MTLLDFGGQRSTLQQAIEVTKARYRCWVVELLYVLNNNSVVLFHW